MFFANSIRDIVNTIPPPCKQIKVLDTHANLRLSDFHKITLNKLKFISSMKITASGNELLSVKVL